MSSNLHDLLTEPAIRVRLESGSVEPLSLPAVLARLSAGDDIESFVALRHHQRHAWFAFLVQLATLALHRAGQSQPPKDEPTWRDLLLALTDGEEAAYCLVVPDLARPAFLQPPVPEGSLQRFKPAGTSADQLDILVVTSKNHDLKAERISHPRVEDWLYALVTLQTMQGYSGARNYGVVRMNSGKGNRACFAFAPSLNWSPRFCRDVRVLLNGRSELIESYGYRDHGGKTLLWLEPWDGQKSAAHVLFECDPFFIEICRRIRLVVDNGSLKAMSAPTAGRRVDDGDAKGDVGDPWTPVNRSEGKALTVSTRGLHYSLVRKVLFSGDYSSGLAQRLYPEDKAPIVFLAETLVRGDRTEGYHRRVLPISLKIRTALLSTAGRERLSDRAEEMIGIVDLIVKSVFRPALLSLLQAAPDKLDFKDDRGEAWIGRLDNWADRAFFEQLFSDLELELDVANNRWARAVLDMAQSLLEEALRSVPLPSIRRYRAEAIATRIFHGAARKRFPDLFPARKETANDQA